MHKMFYKFYVKGSYICKEGEKSDCFFGILKGKVSIRKSNRSIIA
jgi:hypothetical protein